MNFINFKKLSVLLLFVFASFFFFNISSSQAQSCTLTTTLKQGMKGEQVQCLQTKLNTTNDGIFGKNTKASVITFQTTNNLKPDGIVGPLTREILNKEKEIKLPCTQGELFNTITGQSCSPVNITSPISIAPRYFVHVASRYLDVTYIAGSNGSISGSTSQRIIDGGSGTDVTATPDAGYVFDIWSDGVLTATRTDTNVNNDKIVTATFIPTIATAAIAGVTAPVTGATPTATISDTSEYTATISWNTSPSTFASNTIYTATITITPKTGYTLTGVPENFFTVAGATATNTINTGVVSAVFPVTLPITDSTGLTYGTVTGEDGRIWLDRNLGATQVATAFNDYNAYGSLFQWGRPADGHQLITHTTANAATPVNGNTSTLSVSDTPGDALFIKPVSSPNDWRNPQNENLWQGLNGINNPCPTGFRLPTSAEWETLATVAGITNSATAYGSLLKLTLGGYRSLSNASLIAQGIFAYYWSSSVSDTRASRLNFNFDVSSVVPIGVSSRANGFSIRCLKD